MEEETKEHSVRARPWPPKTAKEVRERFERFWLHYPRRVAVKQAMLAWAKLAPTELLLGAILVALEWQVVDWETRARADGDDWREWVPYPSTWLNGMRWLDEMPGRVRQIMDGRRAAARAAVAAKTRTVRELEPAFDEADVSRGEEIRRQARERLRRMSEGIGKP